jgi:hypothetical protein
VLVIVRPDTVVRWHRGGFRLFWRCKSRQQGPGRPSTSKAFHDLIRRMATENLGWGAPRIHGELLKDGDLRRRGIIQKRPPGPRVNAEFDLPDDLHPHATQ